MAGAIAFTTHDDCEHTKLALAILSRNFCIHQALCNGLIQRQSGQEINVPNSQCVAE
jgi:hypothetical protein